MNIPDSPVVWVVVVFVLLLFVCITAYAFFQLPAERKQRKTQVAKAEVTRRNYSDFYPEVQQPTNQQLK